MTTPRQGHRPPLRPVLEAYTAVTGATYTAKAGDRVIGVNRAGAVTVTLPTAEVRPGRVYTVKDESGAAATNNITVATEGSENIDGSATNVIATDYGATTYYSDGTNWFALPLFLQITLGTTPSTQAHGDAAAGGSDSTGSKNDHKHAMPTAGGLSKTSKASGSTAVNANTRSDVNTYVATDAVHTHLYDARRSTGGSRIVQSGALAEGDETIAATVVASLGRANDGTVSDVIHLTNGEGASETFDWEVFLVS